MDSTRVRLEVAMLTIGQMSVFLAALDIVCLSSWGIRLHLLTPNVDYYHYCLADYIWTFSFFIRLHVDRQRVRIVLPTLH